MAKTLGYMLTWTTYGTWLQGDERGYVKDGKIHRHNTRLLQANKYLQSDETVKLSKLQQQIVRESIIQQASLLGQQIYALAVKPTHIHLVVQYIPQPISKVVAYYKKTARLALKTLGYKGNIWTKGYDNRFCFDQESLRRRIKYVDGQNST